MASSQSMTSDQDHHSPWVRPYDPRRDFDSLIDVFRETADSALKTEPSWTYAEYLWIRPYLCLCPESCFVLDNGSGEAVGYIIGTPSTADFARRWALEFLPTVDATKIPLPPKDSKPTWESDRPAKLLRLIYFDQIELLNGQWPKLWEEFPGHLHIDIKYHWTGQGHGQELIRVFVDYLKREGARGVHLGMVATNDRASKFYERLEFNRFPEVLDKGKSGELGRTEGGIIRVKSL